MISNHFAPFFQGPPWHSVNPRQIRPTVPSKQNTSIAHQSTNRGRGLKSCGFEWVANVRGIFGVREDEQVGMSLKLGWKFCSNETTGYQARKEMACITVGDWRLRLIELRNSFERISFFSVYELVYRSVSPQEAVTSTKLLKEAWVAEGERRTAPAGSTSSRRCSLYSRRRGRTNGFFMWRGHLLEAIVALYDELAERFLGTRLWRQFDAILLHDLTWWMYINCVFFLIMFLLERRSTKGRSGGSLQVVKPFGFTAWSASKLVATGQGLKYVGCFCQRWGHWLCFHERSINLENIRTAFR